MSGWLIFAGSVLLYAVGSIFGWRVGYVSGYEGQRSSWENAKHDAGVFRGVLAAILWPLMLPALLVGMHLTPTPPSVIAEANRRLIEVQRREINRLEREAGIR